MWTSRTLNIPGSEASSKESSFCILKKRYQSNRRNQNSALPVDFSTLVFENVNDIPDFWDQLLPEQHPLRKSNLSIYEVSGLEDISFRYVGVYKNGSPIGLMAFQLLNFNHKHLGNIGKNQGISGIFLKCHQVPLLVCGNLFGQNQQGFFLTNPADQILLLPILKELAKKTGACGILIKDCHEPFMESVIRYNKFEPWGKDISMELYIDPYWKNFEGYINSLSRKYLQRAKKIIAAGSDIERRSLNEQEVSKWQSRIEELYMQVALKQPLRMGLLNGNYFRLMHQKFGERFKITGYFLHSELVAFRTTILKSDSEEIHYIGFDQEINKTKSLYFNMLFDGLKDAQERNAKKIELGRTALDAKASLGAKPVMIRNYIQIRNPLAAWVFKSLSGKFENESGDTWQNRNPFKNH